MLRARNLQQCLVGVTPQPVLAGLERANDLVLRGVLAGMAARMLVLGGIATAHLAVSHAHSQMHPGVAQLETLLAARRQWRDVVDLIKVGALHRRLAAYALDRKPDGLQQSHGRFSCRALSGLQSAARRWALCARPGR